MMYRSTHSILQRASLQLLLVRAPLGIVSGLAEKVDGQVLIGIGEDGGGESELGRHVADQKDLLLVNNRDEHCVSAVSITYLESRRSAGSESHAGAQCLGTAKDVLDSQGTVL